MTLEEAIKMHFNLVNNAMAFWSTGGDPRTLYEIDVETNEDGTVAPSHKLTGPEVWKLIVERASASKLTPLP